MANALDKSVQFVVEGVRQDFPILHQQVHGCRLAFLDNAASAQHPQAVIDAISHYYLHDHANVHRGVHTLSHRATEAYEGARETIRRFIKVCCVMLRGVALVFRCVQLCYVKLVLYGVVLCCVLCCCVVLHTIFWIPPGAVL